MVVAWDAQTADLRPAVQFIDARIKALRRDRRVAVRTARELTLRLEELESLKRAMCQPASRGDEAKDRSTGAETKRPDSTDQHPEVTEGILGILPNVANGMNLADIAEHLEKRSVITPQTPKSVLTSSLRGLVKRGRVTQSASGRYYAKNESPSGGDEGVHSGVTGLTDS